MVAGVVFLVVLVCCLLGLPGVGIALAAALSIDVLAAGLYFPAFALWYGHLLIGPWEGGRWVDAASYRAIPLAVWLVTCVGFGRAARGLRLWSQVGAAVGVIVAVTVGMHAVLAALGIRLVVLML